MKRVFLSVLGAVVLVWFPMVARAQAKTYVALGDSVASGLGLPLRANASPEEEICGRSPQAYAYKIASSLNASVEHLACSGAKVDEGLYGSQEKNGRRLTPQIDAAFASQTPELVTITIGANDARWRQFIRDCYVWRCGSDFDKARAKIYRADLRLELYRALSKIGQKSGGNPPRVLISGYYQPFSGNNCSDTRGISLRERQWLRTNTEKLNHAIYSVTPWFSFAKYVPVNFSGHELCSSQPWIQGLQNEAPFHPTADGQSTLAVFFLKKLGY